MISSALLLVSLLQCSSSFTNTPFQGFMREDGSQTMLSMEDIELCYSARSKAMICSTGSALRVLAPITANNCPTEARCRRLLTDNLIVAESDPVLLCWPDPTASWATLYEGLKGRLCNSCSAMLGARDLAERKRGWETLPGLFNIAVEKWGTEV